MESSDESPHPLESNAVARHVSAASLHEPSPVTLRKAMNPQFADHQAWLDTCQEEHDGLVSMETMDILASSQCKNLTNAPKAIPTICVLTVKTNENNCPVPAESRIVVLGNLKDGEWTRPKCCAPVSRQDSLRLSVSLAVLKRRVLKQADCKNAFSDALPVRVCD
jgi:hypothetical protein